LREDNSAPAKRQRQKSSAPTNHWIFNHGCRYTRRRAEWGRLLTT
jgi:hypothetical protein